MSSIAQVYLSFPKNADEPPKRLIAWQKIPLRAGESKSFTLNIDPLYLATFNPDVNRWQIVPGD